MKQYILRITENKEDVEMFLFDDITKKEHYSTIVLKELQQKINDMLDRSRNNSVNYYLNMKFINDGYIAFGPSSIVIKQEEHNRIVTYGGKAYNINFPNAIYFIGYMGNEIKEVKAFCYKKYEGLETNLYKYAMPNMLTENRICMGSAPKKVENNNFVKALEKIIFTQYTHTHTENIKSFKETIKYFEYLAKNKFPYDLLIDTNKKLETLIK